MEKSVIQSFIDNEIVLWFVDPTTEVLLLYWQKLCHLAEFL